MEPVVILHVGVEGGGATVYGRQDGEGNWLFWHAGNSIGWEPGDDWQHWESETTTDLFAALPQSWWHMHPIEVHPNFRERLADELKRAATQDETSSERRRRAWLHYLNAAD